MERLMCNMSTILCERDNWCSWAQDLAPYDGVDNLRMISRREIAVTLMGLVPVICYIVYLYELQDHSMFVANKYGIHTDLSVQGALYYRTGIIEIGVLGIGLTASVLTLYRAKAMDQTQFKLALAGSATLVSLLLIGLNLYYRYYIGLLGL